MPMYCFRCDECGHAFDQARAIRHRNRNAKCPHCGQKAPRTPEKELQGDIELDYAQSVLSDACGVQPEQVAEHRRIHPNIPIMDDGRIVMRSHAERKRILKQIGFVDRDGYN